MQFFPAALQNLADQFARLPGIGGKTAQRLAFHVLSLPLEDAQNFADAIMEAKREVHTCPVCQNLTDSELCPICADPRRDTATICVVTDPKDLIAIERTREYHGLYHVLHGTLSPMDRELLTLYYFSDVPLQEAARLLGKSYPAVRQRMTRLRQTLKQEMEAQGYGRDV